MLADKGKVISPAKHKKVVVIGGGTGTFTILSALKKHHLDLAAIVTMADNGGSTGILRDELGVLPPGDVRQCLVALSTEDRLMRDLMNYRFPTGQLEGHSFGNLLLSALEKLTGSFDTAVEKASQILRVDGRVIPATLARVELVAYLKDGQVIRGQTNVHAANLARLKRICLEPEGVAHPKAIQALLEADVIVVGPGDFYSSLIPNFLVEGIPEAIQTSPARKIYICNLMTKQGHTDGFQVIDFTEAIESYLGTRFDYVLYNNKKPSPSLLAQYARQGEELVLPIDPHDPRFIADDLLSRRFPKIQPGDPLKRNLIRHNRERIADQIIRLIS